jgi:hypothetical protein
VPRDTNDGRFASWFTGLSEGGRIPTAVYRSELWPSSRPFDWIHLIRRNSEALIDTWNADLEPKLRAEWELTNGVRRINLRGQILGKKPEWRFTKKTGKLTRNKAKGGIDWYRYNTTILVPKLLPFAQACIVDRPNIVV